MATKSRTIDYNTNGHSVADVADIEQLEAPGLDIEAARQVVEADRAARAQACMTEINAVLEKYGCTLIAQAVVQAR